MFAFDKDRMVFLCFSEEEINNMKLELDKYGIQMPSFGKIGGLLANELSVDQAAGEWRLSTTKLMQIRPLHASRSGTAPPPDDEHHCNVQKKKLELKIILGATNAVCVGIVYLYHDCVYIV